MFARLGAEVIKIESLRGDESRTNGPIVNGQSAYWVQYNSGKKSLAIDLRQEQGKTVLRDLVKVSDIFLQNFRPGTIGKMGFGYDALRQLNPRIIMINVSAYGQDGPYKDRIGFDPIGQALGGLMSLTGLPGTPPVKTYFPLIDRITALHGTIGGLAALYERNFSGEGQSIDVSLADSGFTTNEIPIAAYLSDGTIVEREGNGRGLTNTYRTTDGWALIHATSDSIWPRVCDALGWKKWGDDPALAKKNMRNQKSKEIGAALENWFAVRSTREAVEYLSKFSVPAAAVNTVEQAANDPHLHEREVLVEVPDPHAGSIHVTGKTIKFGRTPMEVGSAPTVGEHTEDILRDLLGYPDNLIDQLIKNAVIANQGPKPE
jgi:crotonobetainyl-CoA:carnitine CoA-transferase CaiB-like acyl-CoA transferase